MTTDVSPDADAVTAASPKKAVKKETWRSQLVKDMDSYILPVMLVLALLSLFLSYPEAGTYILIAAALLSPCIILHEAGHYVAARRAGLGVEEFSIGFGPRLVSRVSSKTGVRWSLKAVPLGGSVEVQGMTVEAAEKSKVPREKAYIYASIRNRLRVVSYGVVMNFVLAWAALTVVAIQMRPEDTVTSLLLTPVAGLVTVFALLAYTLRALLAAVMSGGEGVTTILTMPQALETGVSDSLAMNQPLWVYFLVVFALLNMSIGVMNSLPMHPLDGYHIAVTLTDGVRNWRHRRRGLATPAPLTQKQLSLFAHVTQAIVFGFVILILGRDLIKLVAGG